MSEDKTLNEKLSAWEERMQKKQQREEEQKRKKREKEDRVERE